MTAARIPAETPCGFETEFGIVGDGGKDGEDFIRELEAEWIYGRRRGFSYDAGEELRQEGRNEREYEEHHRYIRDRLWRERGNYLTNNAARLYLDGKHAEISSPTCLNPYMLLVWNRACYKFVDELRKKHEAEGRFYTVFRNNVAINEDRPYAARRTTGARPPRASYGSHLNMGFPREIPEEELIRKAIPFFTSLGPIGGAGKVHSDFPGVDVNFQITQRSDFIERDIGGNTVQHRAIFDVRDEPHADATKHRRVHIIPFDSNMLELPEYLKAGLISIHFKMIQDGKMDDRFEMDNPVGELHRISWDTSLNHRVWLLNQRKSRNIIDLLWDYYELFYDYVEKNHSTDAILSDVVLRFGQVLELLSKRDFPELYGKLDWVTKMLLLEGLLSKGKSWNDPKVEQADIKYHDNNHGDDGYFYGKVCKNAVHISEGWDESQGKVLRLTTDEEVNGAVGVPPPTRSSYVWNTVSTYASRVSSSDMWHKITFFEEGGVLGRISRFVSLSFLDPYIHWDKEIACSLFSLPLEEFLVEIKKIESLQASVQRMEFEEEDDTGGTFTIRRAPPGRRPAAPLPPILPPHHRLQEHIHPIFLEGPSHRAIEKILPQWSSLVGHYPVQLLLPFPPDTNEEVDKSDWACNPTPDDATNRSGPIEEKSDDPAE